ncbi:MAG: Lrp/AsnC family transcriptional regulator [Candidatus Heimdallarchaeota archaeon]
MLDEKDQGIVEYFKRNPRNSFNKAASELKLSKATVKRRFESLVERGYIRIQMTANASKLDFCHALSFVEITNPLTEKAILERFTSCPLAVQIFSLSGFEYNLVVCLLSKKREDLAYFLDVFPLSRLDGVRRKNSYFAKESESFTEKPFWIPLSSNPSKTVFDEPSCHLKCDDCRLISSIETDLMQ